PSENPKGITEREFAFIEVTKRCDWLPQIKSHLPTAVIMWPGPRRQRIFAIECVVERLLQGQIEDIVKAYQSRRWDRVIILLPFAWDDFKDGIRQFQRTLKSFRKANRQ